MSWKTDVSPPVINGVRYGGKDLEFTRFLELPRRARAPLELAIAGAAPLDRLREHGWLVVSAPERSATMQSYRTYLAGSRGEWSVGKNIYVALRSGWFSCRSAMYLALGKPSNTLRYPQGGHLWRRRSCSPTASSSGSGKKGRRWRRRSSVSRSSCRSTRSDDALFGEGLDLLGRHPE